MSAREPLVLFAPLSGWSSPLEEVPDEVFSGRLLGDGVAIDPTDATLHAPCAGEVSAIAAAGHAITLRAAGGCEILLHVGLDTVALQGQGFELLVQAGAQVQVGDPLMRFDLDLLAQRARSLLTPVILSGEGFRVSRRTQGQSVRRGEFLLQIEPAAQAPRERAVSAAGNLIRARLTVPLAHGLHARPAALLAAALGPLEADVRILAHGREADARSTVALMGLGVRHGDPIELRATGKDAQAALDALAAALREAGARETDPAPAAAAPPAPEARPHDPDMPAASLRGVIASRGLAVGPVVRLRRAETVVTEQGADPATEAGALARARGQVREAITRRVAATAAARGIADAHRALLEDPALLAAAAALIAEGKSAGFAWRAAVREHARVLAGLEDARLRERVADLLDLEGQVLAALDPRAAMPAAELPPQAILVARDLLPSQVLAPEAASVGGLCTAEGGATSHVAILAAAMGIPALAALGPQVLELPEGHTVVLEAERGWLETAPDAARLAQARAQRADRSRRAAGELAAAQGECRTRDGVRIHVLANVGSVAEARAAVRNGAEGCGLLRTEFLFLERRSAPTGAEQTRAYQEIADALGARPLTIRTLDAGGDKPIAYLPLPHEENPALGLRGVRTSLAYPQLLEEQLRAVLAVTGPAECRLLLPMITDAAEVSAVRAVLERVRADFPGRPAPRVGVMIETPASAVLAASLAEVADFLSIGTNDLTQYVLAMDRGHPVLAPRLDALHPAVLALIAQAAEAARARGRPAAVCGGLASEPLAAALLVGLGVDELSAVPAVVPQVKAQLARVTLAQARALAAQALQLPTPQAVRALLAAQAGGSA